MPSRSLSDQNPLPAEAVLQHFQIKPLAFLGGRLNKHWQVRDRQDQLVLRRWAVRLEEAHYERSLREQVAALGWPAAPDCSDLFAFDGVYWSLALLLPGQPVPEGLEEQHRRGRLLAEFHQAMAGLRLPQRPGWRTVAQTLCDPDLERVFTAHLQIFPEPATEYLKYLKWARELLDQVQPAQELQLIHGDFTRWNLFFREQRCSGLLDFELSRSDHWIADFALSWRGHYDEVIHGYHEVQPLSESDWERLTPYWWGWLLEGAYQDLKKGRCDDGWTLRCLRRRSSLMPSGGRYAQP